MTSAGRQGRERRIPPSAVTHPCPLCCRWPLCLPRRARLQALPVAFPYTQCTTDPKLSPLRLASLSEEALHGGAQHTYW